MTKEEEQVTVMLGIILAIAVPLVLAMMIWWALW